VLAVTQADHKRTAEPGAENLAGVGRAQNRQTISALQTRQSPPKRRKEVSTGVKLPREEVGHDLGIGLTLKNKSLRLEFTAKHDMVFNYSVVHDGNYCPCRAPSDVRMGIAIGGGAMRGPPRVTYPTIAKSWIALEELLEHSHPASFLSYFESIVVNRRQTGAVVASVLKPPQPGDQDR